jgi:class 3 adenylate cyclase/tetratricopeptide (TPR) repeat protein
MEEDSPEQIAAAIAVLEAQRSLLGDAVVAMATTPLREKLAAAVARVRRSEQRLKPVTVLFMDVVGSTELSRRLDPEDVHAVLDGALARLTAVVQAHHGRVLQYAGDSLLAVFGADEAHEDDPERAVRAGLALVAEAVPLSAAVRAAHGFDGFDLRVGINTGTVLLGGGVDGEGTIRGITVNIAARMEQSAPAGALRISHDTYRQVRGVFDVSEQPPIVVKGIAGPVRSYLVHRAKPRAFRVQKRGVEGIETRMIGRDAELAKLTDAFEGVVEDQTLAIATVVADAGFGKSRLLHEFSHWLALRPTSVQLFQGRPQPYGNSVPYGLLRDLVAWRFEILDSDPQALAKTKLAAGLAPLFGARADEQTALIGELIGFDYAADPHIAGIADDAKQIRDRGFHALAQFFCLLHESTATPIAVLLDDLHWADDGSLDFVNHLAQACRSLPIMVLCLTRPTLYERRPLWGSGQSNHQRIALAPLSKRSCRELADALLGRLETVPAALRDLLTSNAEGVPYFVEELVGMLIDDGVIVTGPQRWRVVADKLLTVHVPPTLAGVLQARLDALPTAEKEALQRASVIGHVFWDEALRRIAPAAAEPHDGADPLDALTRRELAHGRETSAFEGTREFVFRHHVLHQVTYDSVLKRDKREQHRQTADWLVVRSGDRASEYFGLIADHYERAGDTVNALAYLRKAGEDAASSHVSQAALDYLGRALALVPAEDPATRFALLLSRRSVLSNAGRRAEQAADVAELEQLAEAMDDDAARARAGGLRAAHALVTGDYPGTCAAAARAVAWGDAANDRGAALLAVWNWARALQFQGDYDSAESRTRQCLALARDVGDRRVESTALAQLGILSIHGGRYREGRARYEEALALARAIANRAIEGAMLNNLGDMERFLGNHALALEIFQAGRRVCREIGQRMSEAYVLCNMAHVALVRGDAAGALDWAGESRRSAEHLDDRDLEASLCTVCGHAYAALGREPQAAATYRDAVAIYREIGRPTMPPEPLAGLARLALARGDLDEANHLVADIVAHFDAGGTVDGTEDPMWIYLTCHQVLACARSPRAHGFLDRAHALLMERADCLDSTERETFLANVPSHRAIVAAWATS